MSVWSISSLVNKTLANHYLHRLSRRRLYSIGPRKRLLSGRIGCLTQSLEIRPITQSSRLEPDLAKCCQLLGRWSQHCAGFLSHLLAKRHRSGRFPNRVLVIVVNNSLMLVCIVFGDVVSRLDRLENPIFSVRFCDVATFFEVRPHNPALYGNSRRIAPDKVVCPTIRKFR